MVYSAEQSQQIIATAAYEAAPKYGIRDVDGFVLAMLALSGWESGGWNAAAPGDAGASIGLFQLHERGQGAGMSVAERQDPYTNVQKAITYLAPVYAAAEQAGGGWQEGLRNMAGPQGQNPADPEALYQGALSYVKQLGGLAGTAAGAAGRAGLGGFQEVAPTTEQGVMGFGAWTEQNDPDFPWRDRIRPDQPGLIGDAWLKTLTSQERAAKWERYNAATQADSGLTDLERRETEAGITLDLALAEKYITEIGELPYNKMRQEMLDQFEEKKWTAEQAVSEFNAWMSGALEAGKRAETVYGEEMKRKVWTTPEKHYPGTEPGGINEQMYERYGLEYKPSPGIAVETLPNQEQMYGQWHENMGISQQAPVTQGGWSGQGAGQGTGLNAAMEFLKRMNLRPGVQQGAAPAY